MHEIVAAALKGNFEARRELYFWAYLWPRLQKEFVEDGIRLEGAAALEGGGLSHDLVSTLAIAALGPQPEPPDRPGPEQRVAIAALTGFRKALLRLADEAGAQIDALESGGQSVRQQH